MAPASSKPVSLKATARDTVVHVGDGRRFRGPRTDAATGNPIDGEMLHDVPAAAAEAIVARRLAKVVKAQREAPAEG